MVNSPPEDISPQQRAFRQESPLNHGHDMRRFSSLIEIMAARNPAVNWEERQRSPLRAALRWAERFSLVIEAPLARWIGDTRLNPLYHTGTITIFLLVVLLLTGLYLTMFYPFGFTLSYEAVSRIEANPIGRVIRAMHRYASDGAVLFALLHAWRMFFQDRFRGPRWLAWVSGVALAVTVWLIGVSGYWLLWDGRAQWITKTFADVLARFETGRVFLVNVLFGERAGNGWLFLLLVLLLHLGLSAIVGLLLWLHLKRLRRAHWLPPLWAMGLSTVLLLATAIAFPVGMLPPSNPTRWLTAFPLDALYLFFLSPAWKPLWPIVGALVVAAFALPWLWRAGPIRPAKVDLARCDGCTLCERDCPYGATRMVPRSDGGRAKWEAEIDPSLCVSCGICIGSCPTSAISFTSFPVDSLFKAVEQEVTARSLEKVTFVCERHALARPSALVNPDSHVVPLTCTGMLNPRLVERLGTLSVRQVEVIGCPAEDCANREGNVWTALRIQGARLPRLKEAFRPLVRLNWIAPSEPWQTKQVTPVTSYGAWAWTSARRAVALAASFLLLLFGAGLALSRLPFQFPSQTASLFLYGVHRIGMPIRGMAENNAQPIPNSQSAAPIRLTVEVNGRPVLNETASPRGELGEAFFFAHVPLSPGPQHFRILMHDPAFASSLILLDREITLEPAQIFNQGYYDQHIGGDPQEGRRLFYEQVSGTNAGCRICHSLQPGVVIVGPSLAGIATRAATRVPGLSAEEYIRQSILEPDAYVVPGFPPGQMVQNLGEILTPEQIDDLVAFLMTLK